ncbi:MAG TPA: DNA repair protein RecN [Methylomusa anaerophila]|uniref:DNA repair protein RecN n=1 Tax=Methylomusa anaerophila TaxID=1930071 RepID=A0A348APD1_9FIRM|nr:DNA repair protein RecN [Methylomusa anaerophila]BBB92929.1 DNA repair protein RecN [Methylomusa anaerophila]HML87236.1 DNA repair protein RecN [Methylomusa anaerophila]
MLKSLTVTNFALIEHASIEFGSGLNIITGETGAGKSILIDALTAILGERTSTESIRSGADYLRIEAVFHLSQYLSVMTLLDEQGIPREEDDTLIISRRLTRSGKNTVLVNGCQVTLAILKKICEKLVDMHGQHENLALLKPEIHLDLVDNYHPDLKIMLQEYKRLYRLWQSVSDELTVIKIGMRDRLQRQDLLTWQIQEIAAANLSPGEDEKLEQEIRVLSNAEKIVNATKRSYMILSQGNKGFSGILSCLAEIKRDLEQITKYDSKLESQLNIITESLYQLEEVSSVLRNYEDSIEFNPGKLARLQERLDSMHKLRKKYGTTVEDIFLYYNQAVEELNNIGDSDHKLEELENKCNSLENDLRRLVDDLDRLRRESAKKLADQVTGHLKELGMPKADFIIEVKKTEEFSRNGCNEAVFLFSANPGEDVKPIVKIASGGELSRIALAIKTACAQHDECGIMVFDEVDAGIGGQTAQIVGEKIARISSFSKQVICITHLPHIACMADTHIYISKLLENEKTVTQVEVLSEKDRVTELARMLSGEVTRLSHENAAQMLKSARDKKDAQRLEAGKSNLLFRLPEKL